MDNREEPASEVPDSYGNGIAQASRNDDFAEQGQDGGMATTVAKRTRHDSTESSNAEEESGNNTPFETPRGRSREGSIELGDPSSTQPPVDSTTTATSTTSIFDLPESRSPTPGPSTSHNKKRKRQSTVPSTGIRGRRANKRTKRTGSSTSEEEDFVLQTPSQRSPAKRTFSSAKRSRLPSQGSVGPRSSPDSGRSSKRSEESAESDHNTEASDSGRSTLTCRSCNRVFSSYGHLRRHKRTHNGKTDDATGAKGNFTQQEMDALDSYRSRACVEFGLSLHEFNDLINWPKGNPWPNDNVSKDVLMAAYYDILPRRNKRSLRRYKERWFKNTSTKAHSWSAQQDQELILLVRERGQKWVEIASLIGRTQDEVATHWYNKVQHQDKRASGQWTEEEVRSLRDAVKQCKTRLGVALGPETDHEIRWSVVSDMLGNKRTRQQCSLRWRGERRKQAHSRDTKRLKVARKGKARLGAKDEADDASKAIATSDIDEDETRSADHQEEPRRRSSRLGKTYSLGSRRNPKAKSSEYVHESDSTDHDVRVEQTDNTEKDLEEHMADDTHDITSEQQHQQEESIQNAGNDLVTPSAHPNDLREMTDVVDTTSTSDSTSEPEIPAGDSLHQSNPSNPLPLASKTPVKSLSQLFKATQANSSDIKTDKQRNMVEETPSNIPKRPSPQVVVESTAARLSQDRLTHLEEEPSDDSSTSSGSESEAEQRAEESRNFLAAGGNTSEEEGDDSEESEGILPPPTFSSRALLESSDEEDSDDTHPDQQEMAEQQAPNFVIHKDKTIGGSMPKEPSVDTAVDVKPNQTSGSQEQGSSEDDSSSTEDSEDEENNDARPNITDDEEQDDDSPESEDAKPVLFSSRVADSSSEEDTSDDEDAAEDFRPSLASMAIISQATPNVTSTTSSSATSGSTSGSESASSSSEDESSSDDSQDKESQHSEAEDFKPRSGTPNMSWLQNLGKMAQKIRMSQSQSRPSTRTTTSSSPSQPGSSVERYVTEDGIRKVDEESDDESRWP